MDIIKCDLCGKEISDCNTDLFHHTGIIDGVLNTHVHLCGSCHKPEMQINFDVLKP